MFSAVVMALSVACPLAGCSAEGPSAGLDDAGSGVDAATPQPRDGGNGGDEDARAAGPFDAAAPADARGDEPGDGGFALVNDCTEDAYGEPWVDAGGAGDAGDGGTSRTIAWTFALSPRCIKIRRGEMVTWVTTASEDFSTHPLSPARGSSGSPIPATSSGTGLFVIFPAAGVFGFRCDAHPSEMSGAIWVVP